MQALNTYSKVTYKMSFGKKEVNNPTQDFLKFKSSAKHIVQSQPKKLSVILGRRRILYP